MVTPRCGMPVRRVRAARRRRPTVQTREIVARRPGVSSWQKAVSSRSQIAPRVQLPSGPAPILKTNLRA